MSNAKPINIARQTKYATAVMEALQQRQHATNAELLLMVKEFYTEVSITTIHRVTARLKQRGIIGCAPKSSSGSERYDLRPEPHHHFMCTSCDGLCDVPTADEFDVAMNRLKELSNGLCQLTGALILQGVCKQCKGKV